jgi:hypothetical protein
MSAFSGMFSKNQNGGNDPQAIAMQMIENMKNTGRISNEQYDALMKNRDNPQEMINTMLQNRMASNEQYSSAKSQVSSFLGIK